MIQGINIPAQWRTSATIERVKWLALMCMVIDHLNFFLLLKAHPWMFAVGRLAFPLFAFVLAVNLAGRGEGAALRRAAPKLLGASLLAQLARIGLVDVGVINILASLFLGAWLAFPMTKKYQLAEFTITMALTAIVGFKAEFLWFGIFMVFAFCRWAKSPTSANALLSAFALAALYSVNTNHWALLAPFAVFLCSRVPIGITRLPWLFYAFYPLHFLAFTVLKRLL
jgi:TraX protein